ncbi:asparaginase [Ruegeria sp. Ofav3-42]|nr:asparaginase [Ruegeria sp. Ofav3-42]
MTGGTIAKSYDPVEARLYNHETKVEDLIGELRTDDLDLTFIDLMHRDSLEIGDEERKIIVDQIDQSVRGFDAVLVTHGTDTLPDTAEELCSSIEQLDVPVVFTGAMIPHSIKGSDAAQNVTEALLALRMLSAGVYIVFHNRVLSLPGVRKDYENLTFEKVS